MNNFSICNLSQEEYNMLMNYLDEDRAQKKAAELRINLVEEVGTAIDTFFEYGGEIRLTEDAYDGDNIDRGMIKFYVNGCYISFDWE